MRRHGWSGETWGTVPVLLLMGAAIIGLPRLFPDGFPVRGYGVMLLLGISASVGAAMYRARRVGLDPEVILSAAIWLVVCGIIGARLFYVIEYWGERFGRGSLQQRFSKSSTSPKAGWSSMAASSARPSACSTSRASIAFRFSRSPILRRPAS